MKTWHWIALSLLTIVSLILEFTMLSGHGKHWWNAIPGFYIIWGFVSCLLIVYVSKWLGKLILFRKENYYDK